MCAAPVALWAFGLAVWIYGVSAALLSTIFVAMSFAVAANSASEPSKMGPEKRLFGFSVFDLFALFLAVVADRWLLP